MAESLRNLHRENTTIIANMKSCYFKCVFLLIHFQYKNAVKFRGLQFVSTSCNVDSTSCILSESNIHVKSCRVHVKFSTKLKNVNFKDFKDYISHCVVLSLRSNALDGSLFFKTFLCEFPVDLISQIS